MEIKNETDLKHTFIEAWKDKYPNSHVTPIESNLTQQGIPDLNICSFQEFWIEFKYGGNKLSPLQFSWMKQHRQCGGKVYLVRYKSGKFELVSNEANSVKTYSTLERMVNEWG